MDSPNLRRHCRPNRHLPFWLETDYRLVQGLRTECQVDDDIVVVEVVGEDARVGAGEVRSGLSLACRGQRTTAEARSPSLTQLPGLTVEAPLLTSLGGLPLRGQNQILIHSLLRSNAYQPPPCELKDGPKVPA